MSTPYGYRVTCRTTNQYYIGIRYGKECRPSDLWDTYFTSSTYVKELIDVYGRDDFVYEVLIVSDTPEDIQLWESIVVQSHIGLPMCLNKCISGMLIIDDQVRARMSASHLGKPRDTSTKEKIRIAATERWANTDFKKVMSRKLQGRTWSLTEEQKAKIPHWTDEMRHKGTLAVTGSIWINDGTISKRVPKTDNIPDGWTKGRTKFR